MSDVDDLVTGREAFERRDWVAAHDRLSAVAPERLSPDDLVRLAMSAYLSGDDDSAVRALQRAYRAELDAGEPRSAIRIAFWLGLILITGGDAAVGGGWVARAYRLLEDIPGDVVERGYLLIHTMHQHIGQGAFGTALDVAHRITEYGHQFADPDLLAMGLSSEGRLLIYASQVPQGLARLDEAMVGLTTSEVSPLIAGHVYCSLIEGCQEISDFGRVTEWTAALTRWCDTQPDLVPFTGQCAVHRSQVLRVHGAFSAALDELSLADRRYGGRRKPPAAGLALYERGDILRMTGRYADAEAAYAQAGGCGYDPQPGLALLWLARRRADAAAGAVRRLLAEAHGPVQRSRLLPASVEVLLADGDVESARVAAEELTSIAADFGCAAVRATANYSTGCVLAVIGDAAPALAQLRQAWQLWNGMDAPYESARARWRMGLAFRAMGDEDSATAEFTAAERTFGELGAHPCRQQLERLLRRELPGGLTRREAEVLRLVAAGLSNPQIATELVLSGKTVARHLSNIYGKIDVTSRTAAAAYAFEHELT
jgi:DNA-binding CsgD family transcriptional regulator